MYLQGFDVNANATTKPGLTLTTFEDKIRQFAALFDGIEKKFTETALSMFNVIGNHIQKVSLEVVNAIFNHDCLFKVVGKLNRRFGFF